MTVKTYRSVELEVTADDLAHCPPAALLRAFVVFDLAVVDMSGVCDVVRLTPFSCDLASHLIPTLSDGLRAKFFRLSSFLVERVGVDVDDYFAVGVEVSSQLLPGDVADAGHLVKGLGTSYDVGRFRRRRRTWCGRRG